MILVAGYGFLGSYIISSLPARTGAAAVSRSAPFQPDGSVMIKCDLTNPNDIKALARDTAGRRLTVFYLAAMHNIDRVFEDPGAAAKVNIDALASFLDIMGGSIDKLFFASTDCVYGENTEQYPVFYEDSPLNPVNIYGEQKIKAEELVRQAGYVSLRLPYMLGPSLIMNRKHFYDVITEKLKNGESIEMIDGMKRSVMEYAAVAKTVIKLAELPKEKLPGTINIAGDAAQTKYETGLAVAEKCGLDKNLIVPISFEEGKKFFKDRRADCSVMGNRLLKEILGG